MIRSCKLACLVLFTAVFPSLFAQGQKGYHLFNAAPKDSLRPFSIDRPDVTETPITVDAGHFQFEGDLIKWVKDKHGKSNRAYNFMSALYKMGITHSWDIHIGLELYNIYQDAEKNKYSEGYGTTTVRLKHNFWGNNDKSRTGFGMIPYVTFLSGDPTDSDIVYGVGFPFLYHLSDKYDLGAQPQFDFIPNAEGNHELSYFQTVVIGGELIGELDFFVEALAVFTKHQNQFLIDGGLVYNISPNMKADIATNVGLTKKSPTRIYLGFSFRL